jgi:hypothetical protein
MRKATIVEVRRTVLGEFIRVSPGSGASSPPERASGGSILLKRSADFNPGPDLEESLEQARSSGTQSVEINWARCCKTLSFQGLV